MSSIVRARRAIGVAALVVAISAVALMAGGAGAGSQSPLALPRQSTLYTSGTAWGPFASFNPLRTERSTGTVGLLYETLFRYDPLADKYIPWLATSGKWVGRTYVMTLRSGVKWNDGKPLTGADVKFTFETGKLEGSEYSTMWKTGLSRITVEGQHGQLRVPGRPNYLDWATNMYSIPIVPRHIWSGYSATEITTGNTDTVSKMVGTGPFRYGAGKGTSGTLQWNRRNDWWATKALGVKMPMQYIVDIHNTQNTASLQNFLQNNIDLSNNFFPGIEKQIGGKVQTYYTKAPFMLSANTAWLVPNTTKKPLNDRAFRRALAMSINIDQIVTAGYGNIVAKANPTGLLPTWNKWIDKAQVAKLGFKYNVAGAKALLAANGYRDTNSDGYVENKDGSNINLRIIVPNGWSDWMTAIQIIAASAKNAGIQPHARLPRLQRARRRAELGQVRPRHRQRQAARPDAVHVLRLPLPSADRGFADVRELRTVHRGRRDAVGADARPQQGASVEREEGEADPLEDPAVHPSGPACDPALVQRHVGPVQHDVLDELPDCHRQGTAEHAERLERVPQHDGHRRAREAQAEEQVARRRLSESRSRGAHRRECSPAPGVRAADGDLE